MAKEAEGFNRWSKHEAMLFRILLRGSFRRYDENEGEERTVLTEMEKWESLATLLEQTGFLRRSVESLQAFAHLQIAEKRVTEDLKIKFTIPVEKLKQKLAAKSCVLNVQPSITVVQHKAPKLTKQKPAAVKLRRKMNLKPSTHRLESIAECAEPSATSVTKAISSCDNDTLKCSKKLTYDQRINAAISRIQKQACSKNAANAKDSCGKRVICNSYAADLQPSTTHSKHVANAFEACDSKLHKQQPSASNPCDRTAIIAALKHTLGKSIQKHNEKSRCSYKKHCSSREEQYDCSQKMPIPIAESLATKAKKALEIKPQLPMNCSVAAQTDTCESNCYSEEQTQKLAAQTCASEMCSKHNVGTQKPSYLDTKNTPDNTNKIQCSEKQYQNDSNEATCACAKRCANRQKPQIHRDRELDMDAGNKYNNYDENKYRDSYTSFRSTKIVKSSEDVQTDLRVSSRSCEQQQYACMKKPKECMHYPKYKLSALPSYREPHSQNQRVMNGTRKHEQKNFEREVAHVSTVPTAAFKSKPCEPKAHQHNQNQHHKAHFQENSNAGKSAQDRVFATAPTQLFNSACRTKPTTFARKAQIPTKVLKEKPAQYAYEHVKRMHEEKSNPYIEEENLPPYMLQSPRASNKVHKCASGPVNQRTAPQSHDNDEMTVEDVLKGFLAKIHRNAENAKKPRPEPWQQYDQTRRHQPAINKALQQANPGPVYPLLQPLSYFEQVDNARKERERNRDSKAECAARIPEKPKLPEPEYLYSPYQAKAAAHKSQHNYDEQFQQQQMWKKQYEMKTPPPKNRVQLHTRSPHAEYSQADIVQFRNLQNERGNGQLSDANCQNEPTMRYRHTYSPNVMPDKQQPIRNMKTKHYEKEFRKMPCSPSKSYYFEIARHTVALENSRKAMQQEQPSEWKASRVPKKSYYSQIALQTVELENRHLAMRRQQLESTSSELPLQNSLIMSNIQTDLPTAYKPNSLRKQLPKEKTNVPNASVRPQNHGNDEELQRVEPAKRQKKPTPNKVYYQQCCNCRDVYAIKYHQRSS